MELAQRLAAEFNLTRTHADNVISLIDSGNTIPFIARYRKEQTGSCDDQVLHALAARLETLRGLERRKGEVAAA
ncbi:MAG: RNA-binding transcriptional accessory protein, partial [Clostridia bacterium]|nr:RNA-binding transcriptional accessory protein [Clostridia bacterium]